MSQIQDRNVVTHVLDDAQVVADEQVGEAEFFLKAAQQIQDLCLDRNIQRRNRLVAHDQIGLGRQGPGDPDPLPLPAGELMWKQGLLFRSQADQAEQFRDAVPSCLVFPHIKLIQRGADNLTGTQARVQR